ncbi:11154_t:CDS:2 [Entrophospora sp. SA101]|nr:11154_t:CDS:2 [Entrophospora sp. SA101]
MTNSMNSPSFNKNNSGMLINDMNELHLLEKLIEYQSEIQDEFEDYINNTGSSKSYASSYHHRHNQCTSDNNNDEKAPLLSLDEDEDLEAAGDDAEALMKKVTN